MSFQIWSAPVELIPSVIVPLNACLGTCTGITFIASPTLAVCKNPRIHCHKTFAGLARRGKTSTGWFYGFKLHLIVNDRGELIDFVLTPGNVDDRKPVPRLARRLFGKLFGDKGYLSKALRDELWRMFNVQLITGIRTNILLPLLDKLLLRRRVIVETIVDQLKNISQIERVGRKMPLQRTQREELWQVFERMWRLLEEQHRTTYSAICYAAAEYLNQHPEARYRCVVVDEAQDFGPAELTLIRALAPTDSENALFLCADTRQRIYRPAVPWVRFGIDTRGRSYTLRVNYRTTRQIQDFAERVLPQAIEGLQEDETRILSDRPIALMHGVVPEMHGYENIPAEMRGLKEWIYRCLNENIQPGEIAIFARSENALRQVETMLREEVSRERGIQARRLQRTTPPVPHELNYGTAHNAKGLEFRAVAVVQVTAGYFPNYSANKDITDTAERKAKEDQERQLLYTVCTRARERLYISWSPTTGRSKFLPNR